MDRDSLVYKAKLAEQAERWVHVTSFLLHRAPLVVETGSFVWVCPHLFFGEQV